MFSSASRSTGASTISISSSPLEAKSGTYTVRPMRITAMIDTALGKDIQSRTVQQLSADGKQRLITALRYKVPLFDQAGVHKADMQEQFPLVAPLALKDAPLARKGTRFIADAVGKLAQPVSPDRVATLARQVCSFVRDSAESNLGWLIGTLVAELGLVDGALTPSHFAALLDEVLDPANGLTLDHVLVALAPMPCLHHPNRPMAEPYIEVLLQRTHAALSKYPDTQGKFEFAQGILGAVGPALTPTYNTPQCLLMLLGHVLKLAVPPSEPAYLFCAWLEQLMEHAKGDRWMPTLLQMLDDKQSGLPSIETKASSATTASPQAFDRVLAEVGSACVTSSGKSGPFARDLQMMLEWTARHPHASRGLVGFMGGMASQRNFSPSHMEDVAHLLVHAKPPMDTDLCCDLVGALGLRLVVGDLLEAGHLEALFRVTRQAASSMPPGVCQRLERAFLTCLHSDEASDRTLEAVCIALLRAAARSAITDGDLEAMAQWVTLLPRNRAEPSAALRRIAGVLLDPALPPHRCGALLRGIVGGLEGLPLEDEEMEHLLRPVCTRPSFDGPNGVTLVAHLARALCTDDVAWRGELHANPLMAVRKSGLPEREQLACVHAAYRIPGLLDATTTPEQLWLMVELMGQTGVDFALALAHTVVQEAGHHVTTETFAEVRKALVTEILRKPSPPSDSKRAPAGSDESDPSDALQPGAPDRESKAAPARARLTAHDRRVIGLIKLYRSYWKNTELRASGDSARMSAQRRLLEGELDWLQRQAGAEQLSALMSTVKTSIHVLGQVSTGKPSSRVSPRARGPRPPPVTSHSARG